MGRREELGLYRLVRRLASGDRATLYEGKDLEGGGSVLVCVLSRRHTEVPAYVEALRGRVERVRRLDPHDHVVRTIERGEDGGFHYLVHAEAPGTPLPELVEKKGHRTEREALKIALGACRALAHLERAGLAAGGIGPEQVLVAGDDAARLVGAALPPVEDGGEGRTALARDVEAVKSVLSIALAGTSRVDVDSPDAEKWTGRTRRLLAELGRPEGPPPMEGLDVLERRLEEALHGPSSVPVVPNRPRPGPSPAANRLAIVLSTIGFLAGGTAVAILVLLLSGGPFDEAGPGGSDRDRASGDLAAGGEGGSGRSGSGGDDAPIAPSPFGRVEGAPGPGPEDPRPAPDPEPEAPKVGEAGPIDSERADALALLEGRQFRSIRERMVFLLEVHGGTPDEEAARSLAADMERRIEEETVAMFREIEAARSEGRRDRAEALCRYLIDQGDSFAQYRASLVLAVVREEVREVSEK